jgi:hypothetical protein
MAPINERDLPLLEVLAAAPDRVVPAEKVEPLALILLATGLLQTGDYLSYDEPNGHPHAAPQLKEAFRSAADYRCAFLSKESFGLTQEGRLYLQNLGLQVSDKESELVAALIDQDATELLRRAEELLRT